MMGILSCETWLLATYNLHVNNYNAFSFLIHYSSIFSDVLCCVFFWGGGGATEKSLIHENLSESERIILVGMSP